MTQYSLKSIFSYMMRSLGVGMVALFIILVLAIFYSYVYDVCLTLHLRYLSRPLDIAVLVIGIYLVLSIVFNFVMSVVISPGTIKDLPSQQDDLMQIDFTQLSDLQIEALKQHRNINVCKKCVKYKPERAHHCSICNVCVFKMDHHCPWINNCVGYETCRYFNLFLFWLVIATGWMSALSGLIYYDEKSYQISTQIQTAAAIMIPLVIILFVVLLFFAGWNWYLLLTGKTTIEFWGLKMAGSNRSRDERYDYSSQSYRKNLVTVFGTSNLAEIFLWPSIKPLPHNGTFWSKKHSASGLNVQYQIVQDEEAQGIFQSDAQQINQDL